MRAAVVGIGSDLLADVALDVWNLRAHLDDGRWRLPLLVGGDTRTGPGGENTVSDWLKMFDKKEPSDPIQTVREGIGKPHMVGTGGKSFGEAMNTDPDPQTGEGTPRFVHDRTRCRACRARDALDRIEAVVKAARAVKHGAPVTKLDEALAALDSQEEGT